MSSFGKIEAVANYIKRHWDDNAVDESEVIGFVSSLPFELQFGFEKYDIIALNKDTQEISAWGIDEVVTVD